MQSALYKGDYRKKSHNSCTKSTPHSTATRSNQRQLAATQKTQFTNGYVYMENNGFSPHSPRCHMKCQFGTEPYANENSPAAENEPTESRGNSRKVASQRK